MVINKELLEKRRNISEHRPKFVRQESWRYDRLAENWRKPKGKDNKMRLQVSGVPSIVKIGYRGPKISRGLHPSGYVDRLVCNVNEIEKLNPKNEAARISRTVGKLKKKQIVSKAFELGIKVLNPGKSDSNSKLVTSKEANN
ncbi:MAG: 50S ribosomal protein L32e [Nitrososphaeraceae archaeon]|nr:50S ribosomal protein L32e [Nitrososphaeraceae archaeon]